MISFILLELPCSGRYLFARAQASRKRGMVLTSGEAALQGVTPIPELSHQPRHLPAQTAARLPRWAEVHLWLERERSRVRPRANRPPCGTHLRDPLGFAG